MGNKQWTHEEDAKLIELASKGVEINEIAKSLGRHVNSIKYRAYKVHFISLNVKNECYGQITYKQRHFIDINKKLMSIDEMADILSIENSVIESYINSKKEDVSEPKKTFVLEEVKKSVRNQKSSVLSKADIEYIRKNHKKKSADDISSLIGKSKEYIYAEIMKIKNEDKKEHTWTSNQIDFLKENYKKMNYSEIGYKLGKKTHTISNKVSELGLEKKKYVYKKGNNRQKRIKASELEYIDDTPYSVIKERNKKKIKELEIAYRAAMDAHNIEEALRISSEISEMEIRLQSFRFKDDYQSLYKDNVVMHVYNMPVKK